MRQVSSVGEAYAIRISAHTPATRIVAASAPVTWHQADNFPSSVVWVRADGAAIPQGDPLPGTFSIWVRKDAQKDKRVQVDWLREDRRLLCRQILHVGCGRHADSIVEDTLRRASESRVGGCRCLSVETAADEDANQLAEPDLSVEVGKAMSAGFNKVTVPYSIEVEPPTLAFTRKWEVTLTDEVGDEQPIVVPFVDDLKGVATFELPEAGDYSFYLTVTDPATCFAASDRDDEECNDMDFTTFRLASVGATIGVKGNVDPCDPRKYEFRDLSEPAGFNPHWKTTDPSGIVTVLYPDNDGVVRHTFPSLDVTYEVCLYSDSYAQVCSYVTPTANAINPAFHIDYDSCRTQDFVVAFLNDSTTPSCPVSWDWDFGDGAPHSSERDPQHTYAASGSYDVTLTMKITGTPDLHVPVIKKIVLKHWAPTIVATVCPDGHVIYETTAECNLSDESFPHCDRTWSFPDGDFNQALVHRRRVRVCYADPGVKTAYLYARELGRGACTAEKRVIVSEIERCCRHDKLREAFEFEYGSKKYRLLCIFKYYGLPSRLLAKSKLQVWRNGKWRRKRARRIGVKVEGAVFHKKASTGCHAAAAHSVSVYHRWKAYGRARVAYWFQLPIGPSYLKQGSLASTHIVEVDENHDGETRTLSLWAHDCRCS